jgi:hypothetical protein
MQEKLENVISFYTWSGSHAFENKITQVSDVYVIFYVELDFDHTHDVLSNFIYG